MKLEVFIEIIGLLKTQAEKEEAAYKAGIDIINFNDPIHAAVSHLIGTMYGIEGKDVFEWWCYEKEWGTREDLTLTLADGTESCRTVEELHSFLEDYKEGNYDLPQQMTTEERLAVLSAIFGNTGQA